MNKKAKKPAGTTSDSKQPTKQLKTKTRHKRRKEGWLTSVWHAFVKPPLIALGLCAVFSTATHLMPEDWVTDSLEDYEQEHGLVVPVLESVDTKNIRVYNPSNPLTYFHRPGQMVINVFKAVNMGYYPADITGDGEAQAWEKLLSASWKSTTLYTTNMFESITQGVAAIFTDAGAFALPAIDKETGGFCYIYPPQERSYSEFVNMFTGIPEEYIADYGIDNKTLETWTMLHEARHCDWYGEGGADIHAVQRMLQEPGNENLAKMMLAARAMSPFSREMMSTLMMEDTEHATALYLDYSSDEVLPFLYEDELEAKAEQVAALVRVRIQSGQFSAENYQAEVYLAMHDILESRVAQRDPYILRQAELYIEGMEFLAPEMPTVKRMMQEKQQPTTSSVPDVKNPERKVSMIDPDFWLGF